MKKFLRKIFLYCFSIIIICFIVQYVVDKGFRKYNVEEYAVWNKIFAGKVSSDIIIIGSSRARHQFDPKIFEDSLNLSCYNIGIDGGKLKTIKSRWDSYKANDKSPKILILNFDLMYFNSEGVIMNKEKYLPYLNEESVATDLEAIDNQVFLEKNIPLYKYRGLSSQILLGLKLYFITAHLKNSNEYNGALLYNKPWKEKSFAKFKSQNEEIYYPKERLKTGFAYLTKLAKECKRKSINLILVYAPIYYKVRDLIPQADSVVKAVKKLARNNNFEFWDFSKDTLSFSVKYFFDSLHLNKTGAEIFSREFSSELKEYLNAENKNPIGFNFN